MTVFGGGVYDGKINTSLEHDTNGISRAYMVSALHARPKDMLVIGLSGGAWAKVIGEYSPIERITVVEINPAYLSVISDYGEVSGRLADPKIDIVIDDGRRWLKAHPEVSYDMIVMNTTFHWRDGATNLLSEEMLRLFKARLKPGGVIYLNTTWADEVVYGMALVFPHVVKYQSMAAASMEPFSLSVPQRRANLLRFIGKDGAPALDEKNPVTAGIIDELTTVALPDLGVEYRSKNGLSRVTDDNMALEFKKRGEWYNPASSWRIVY